MVVHFSTTTALRQRLYDNGIAHQEGKTRQDEHKTIQHIRTCTSLQLLVVTPAAAPSGRLSSVGLGVVTLPVKLVGAIVGTNDIELHLSQKNSLQPVPKPIVPSSVLLFSRVR